MSKQQMPKEIINQVIAEEQLPADFSDLASDYFVPLSDYIVRRHAARRTQDDSRTLVVGINGAQGTGKSTLSGLLRRLLKARQLECVVISIDDLYLTQDERRRLAAEVHPLLRTRGVPGTHDLAAGLKLMAELKAANADSRVSIPVFDKARDERSVQQDWRVHAGPVDVIVLEGWCVGAPPTALAGTPINSLEQEHDSDGVWRGFIEAQLLQYKQLFSQIDLLVMLKAPSMECVIEWRTLQEEKLREKSDAVVQGIMDKDELRRFIMHYERLTRHMLGTMPARADVVFYLNERHRIIDAHYLEQAPC